MDFDAFIDTAWADHGEQPEAVADRLAASLERVSAPAHIGSFARLAVHVYGVHLGRVQAGVELLDALRTLDAFDTGPAAEATLVRGIATLRLIGGASDALHGLDREDRIAALATASTAFAERGDHRLGIDTLNRALDLAAQGLPEESHAQHALAAGGNNLAVALEMKPARDAFETQGMITAAEAGLRYWKLAGTWLEVERAEYRLARSLLKAQRPVDAWAAAQRCLAVCEVNDAPAFERFFGHAALALAQHAAGDAAAFAASRAAASDWLARVADAERAGCEPDRAELESAASAASAAVPRH